MKASGRCSSALSTVRITTTRDATRLSTWPRRATSTTTERTSWPLTRSCGNALRRYRQEGSSGGGGPCLKPSAPFSFSFLYQSLISASRFRTPSCLPFSRSSRLKYSVITPMISAPINKKKVSVIEKMPAVPTLLTMSSGEAEGTVNTNPRIKKAMAIPENRGLFPGRILQMASRSIKLSLYGSRVKDIFLMKSKTLA